ncbi:ectonucleoside triphosphate diphosphohydrolase 5 isoform X2 [Toxorhynchites rutilus septentrionalis]|uniref:ectonucleoside triphosphate diphosphohydrolase 5 isoform X2 n=1 Tax=Toxorhynchites rutilus septentrionalis TaxID=329112 RepID=UPI0024799B17|nr:ectonucleoside triphosphate diphosphohydrolase 5 isoform X2 [Toxorhynchites rutilus septentrionalis]
MQIEYQLLQQQDPSERTNAPAGSRRKASHKGVANNLRFSFFCLVVSASLLIFLFLAYTDSFHPIVDSIAGTLGYHEKIYTVVVDAGSTGSRVLAFEFHRGYLDGRLVLDSELFRHSKPGLSAFADRPIEGAASIEKLLQEAKNVIPQEKWKNTPLLLKATAGLRLLKPEQAEGLLQACKDLFVKSGFQVNDQSVEIMDGTDEGIFSWFTLNFLLGKLNGRNTVAALDLGGGSTQVTFVPKDISQTPLYKDYMHRVPTFNSFVEVFTTSFLGAGLMAVRHAVFTNGAPEGQRKLVSECVNPIIKDKLFRYGTEQFYISGKDNSKASTENPEVDYELCSSVVRKKVLPTLKPKPVTLKQREIAAFSYFFDRAIETGLVDPFQGGEITVGDFITRSREVCAEANADQPFMCVDLTFIAVLLEEGYGLKPKTPLKLYKKIDGHEISWALGCAYNILTSNKSSQL